jgi:hypothetical protein
MKRIILIFILLFVLFSTIGISCEKQPTLNCEQACKYEGYKEGECKKLPVIEKPCESIGEITLDFQCEQKPQKNIVGVDYWCCCRK